jgi:acyl carrier protein
MSLIEVRNADRDSALRDRVRELVATTLVVDVDEIGDDTSQQTHGRWTSLHHMMLLVVLEEQFGVQFSMQEMSSMTSVPAIVTVLKDRGAAA